MMSLLFTDSVDGSIVGENKWDVWDDVNNEISTLYGRRGTLGFRGSGVNFTQVTARHVLASPPNKIFLGRWLYADNFNSHPSDALWRADSATSFFRVRFGSNNNYLVDGTDLSLTEIGDPGSGQRFTWIFLEVSVEFGVGAEVRVNGESIWTGALGGSGVIVSAEIVAGGSIGSAGARVWTDDIYICDDQGSAPCNTFLGPVQITGRKPNGNGAHLDMVGSDADSVDNYLLVNDGADSTYVDGASNQLDTYEFEDSVYTDAVLGVGHIVRASDAIAAGATFRAVVRPGATDTEGEVHIAASAIDVFFQGWEVNPDTTSPWTAIEIDDTEWGVKTL